MTKSVKVVSVPAEGDLKATELNSDLRSLGTSRSSITSLSVHDQMTSAVSNLTKKPATTGKLPFTRKDFASGGGKIKLMVLLAASILTKPATYFQGRSHLVSRRKGVRCLCSSASPALRSGKVNNDIALAVLFDCNDSAGEASS